MAIPDNRPGINNPENPEAAPFISQENKLLDILMNYSKDMIYFKDKESRFIRVNKAYATQFGFKDPSELVGMSDFDIFKNEHARDAYDDEQRIMATGVPLIGKIEKETSPDEPERWVITSKGPIVGDDGSIAGTFGISRDVSEIKKYENDLKHINEVLELRVSERTADLTTANLKLKERIAQLDFITITAFEMAQLVEVEELLPVILATFVSRFEYSCAALSVLDDTVWKCRSVSGLKESEILHRYLAGMLVGYKPDQLKQPVIIENWNGSKVFIDMLPQQIREKTCYMVIPLYAENRTCGVVQLFASSEAKTVYQRDEKMLATIASQAAISLSNAIHFQKISDQARLQGELNAARSIQRSLMPTYIPDIPHVDLKGVYYPAFDVSGDYLDYFKTEEGFWILVVADVCGKGVPAALLMTLLRSAFRAEAKNLTTVSARNLVLAVNKCLENDLDYRSFVSALCLIISPDGKEMSYARAGHLPLIRINASSNSVESIACNGIALGITKNVKRFTGNLEEKIIRLSPGDRYLLYTDGLTEAHNPAQECYGQSRLERLLESHCPNEPEQIIRTIMTDVKSFIHDHPYHDDLTMLVFTVK
jgi:PAS domain S-box-containing protein